MKLGFSTWGMPKLPIDLAIDHIASLGFDGIEVAVLPGYTTELNTLDRAERQRIARLLRERDLALPAIAAHRSLLETDPEKHADHLQRLHGAIELAVDWATGDHPPYVLTTLGGKSGQWETAKPLLVERTQELAAFAGERGVTIAIEPHVGQTVDDPKLVLELLDAVDSPHLKVNFDISQFNVRGIPIDESVSMLADHAVYSHVKDERGQEPDFEFLIPGEGECDYVHYLRTMQQNGYDGFITAEISYMVQRRPDYDPLAAATQSYRILSQAFADAGVPRG
jgi:sugar phosphate isomerase/epimerase